MNKILADALAQLNAVLAAGIIIVGFIVGGRMDINHTGVFDLGGALLGATVGGLVAVLVCGWLALFIDIRNELVRIRKGDANADSGSAPFDRFAPNSIAATIRGNTISRGA